MARIALILLLISDLGLQAQIGLFRLMEQTISSNKPELLLRLESRNAFLVQRPIVTQSLKLGARFGPDLGLGVGLHTLNKASRRRLSAQDVKLVYVSCFVEYTFFRKGRFTANMPIQVGFGSLSYRAEQKFSSPLIMYEAISNVDMRFLRYFSAGVGLGYRVGLQNKLYREISLSSPVFAWRLSVMFEELYKRVKS